MKPSVFGNELVLKRFPDIQAAEWIAIGDSWIDGKAANSSGVAFIGYGAKTGLQCLVSDSPQRSFVEF